MRVNARTGEIERAWKTHQVAEIVDASYRQLHRWCQLGVFGDPLEAGSGSRIVMEDTDVEQAWVSARLVELGCEVQILVPVMAQVRESGRPEVGQVLVVWPEGVALRWHRSNVFPADPCWVVPLRTVEEIIAEWDDRAWQRT